MADETCIPPCAPNEAQALPTNNPPVMEPAYMGGGGGTGPQGPVGPQGPQGAQGPQGLQGPAGPQGATGPAGADGVDGADGATGPAGAGLIPDAYGALDEAKVTAVQTADVDYIYVVTIDNRVNQTLPAGINGDMERHIIRFNADDDTWQDFGPFTGVDGPAGPPGATGATGPQGPAGAAGAQGPAGATGADGATGAVGPAGPAGPQGVQGLQGPAGADGATGAVGPAGPAGAQGPAGPAGADAPAFASTDSATIDFSGAGTGGSPLTAVVKKSNYVGNQLKEDANGLYVAAEIELVTDATTVKTLAISDSGKYIRMTNGAAKVLNVPTNAAIAVPVGATIAFINAGANNLTITPAGGVTVNKPAAQGFVLLPFSSAVLTKVALNEWDLAGNMELV